ncbi:glycine cleavage system aminomethyltransferase GcvT [Microbacterium oleivorans]|uniref:glycine cleavage system aminomethyltransferase GcvT n=1 Tax=Microbacterium oleivorans TaxID=273677 RepID=UPI0020414DEA|nr:glycine cleavage system aminomethyltransferase GcvT [Microbacterium oleivorans]MCM3696222.1 glycine cleavage system aminomethyltransferase GcvT [Microbacterium oleivorans]
MTDTTTDARRSPLHELHERLGASFTDFGGWLMPVRYTSDLAEHHAVRRAAGIFDISHMAEFRIEGTDAGGFLDRALAGRISSMKVGKAKYSLVLAADGGIVDDVIVYRITDEEFLVISNAGNRDEVAVALGALDARDARIEDITDRMSLIAVQGPAARGILESTAGIEDVEPALADMTYYSWAAGSFQGHSLFVARTGYTGEDGFELMIPTEVAAGLWEAVTDAGADRGLVPAGLAARDTLRLEAGMPLYGHELSRDIVPSQAGLGRVVALDKADFVGKGGLAARDVADAPVLVGLVADGRRAGRAGYAVLAGDDTVGEITSGALSPTLGHPVAMALVHPSASAEGTALTIDVRGTRIPATVTALPFYRRQK